MIYLLITLLLAVNGARALTNRVLRLGLDECLELARKRNRMGKISAYDVRIAQAVIKQAKSAYWPSLSGGVIAGLMDEPLVFSYPASSLSTPPITIPGVGTLPGQEVQIPSREIEMMDDAIMIATLDLLYPLYTGGIRKAANQRAEFGAEAARQGVRRALLEVEYDVERAYYGAVVARNLVQISKDAVARLDATLSLTKRLYEEGSGEVKKTDFLRNQSTLEMVRSRQSDVEARLIKADTALAHLIGLKHGVRVVPIAETLPCDMESLSMSELQLQAVAANPELARLRAGIEAARARVRMARGAHRPKVALVAKYVHMENELETGFMAEANRDWAAIGIAAKVPLFEGFRTKNEVLESKLELDKLLEQQRALEEGIVLKLEHALAEFQSARRRENSTKIGQQAASENRRLHERAYRDELVKTKDVVEAQLTEALFEADYQKALYDCVEAQARLRLLAGTDMRGGGMPTD